MRLAGLAACKGPTGSDRRRSQRLLTPCPVSHEDLAPRLNVFPSSGNTTRAVPPLAGSYEDVACAIGFSLSAGEGMVPAARVVSVQGHYLVIVPRSHQDVAHDMNPIDESLHGPCLRQHQAASPRYHSSSRTATASPLGCQATVEPGGEAAVSRRAMPDQSPDPGSWLHRNCPGGLPCSSGRCETAKLRRSRGSRRRTPSNLPALPDI